MTTQEIHMPVDREIQLKLEERTTEEAVCPTCGMNETGLIEELIVLHEENCRKIKETTQEIHMPTDREIRIKLSERTTEELVAFQRKLRSMTDPTPQAWAIRLCLIKELMVRHLNRPLDRSGELY